MSAQIIPFRKRPAPINPMIEATAQYFIALAVVGLALIAAAEGFMGERR